MATIEKQYATKHNIRGGTGQVDFEYVLPEQYMGNQGKLFARVTLHPHSSIGYHEHIGDTETYFIMQGSGRYNDNGTWIDVKSGDVLFADDGKGHGLENPNDEAIVFMALILNK